ncbi:DUF3426 domain-containing protein [Marinicellulosiphila megalodicopiae]|uniref:DUF3426 domain-containing protein n=1 Tax=Marinicellulosiphila megalodicopiae TaxID=2724896 RepID=UPI003BAEDE4B
MADSFITKCPHCQVKFKLTESQINAAAGSVRCGACLNVFNAKNHLIEQAIKPATPAKTVQAKKVITETRTLETQTEVDDLSFSFDIYSEEVEDDLSDSLFSDLDDQPSEYDLSGVSATDDEDDISDSLFSDLDSDNSSNNSSNNQSESYNLNDDSDDINSLFEQDDHDLNEMFESTPSNNTIQTDKKSNNTQSKNKQNENELYDINNLFDSESDSESDSQSDSTNSNDNDDDSNEDDFIFGVDEKNEFEIDDDFLNFEENIEDAFSDDAIIAKEEITEKVSNPDDETTDESWTKALIEDDEPEENKAVFTAKNLGESSTNKTPTNKRKSFYSEQLPNEFDDDVTEIVNKKTKVKDKQNPKNIVHKVAQDTHELDSLLEKGSRGILTLFAWSFLSAILLLTLAGQYIYYNFDYLAQSKWRPQLTTLCNTLNCTIPDTKRISPTISIEKFQVVEHPELPDAVKVLFVLRNSNTTNADYPNVVIQVLDKNDKLIGDQSFSPKQYLPSQIKTDISMRAKTDVQAVITIKDLGTAARNYKVSL